MIDFRLRMSSNIFSVLTKKKEVKKKIVAAEVPIVPAETEEISAEKKAELEKAIFGAHALGNGNWADDEDEEQVHGAAAQEEEDGWSRVPVRSTLKLMISDSIDVGAIRRERESLDSPSQRSRKRQRRSL